MKYWFMRAHSRKNNLVHTILAVVITTSYALAAGIDGGKQPSNAAPFPGLSLKIRNGTVPPGGEYQLQVMVTEPKPVGAGSPGITLTSSVFGTGEGASVNDPSGQACGVAVRTLQGFNVSLLSPNATLGTNGDAAIITIVLPVRTDAQVGLQIPVNFDLSNTVFLDNSGQPYPLQLAGGSLKIGGTLNITDVIPEGETAPAGSTISILGTGLTPSTRVDIEGTIVVTTHFASPQQLDVTLDRAVLLDGVRVRVRTDTEEAFFFPYLHTAEIGHSSNQLIAAADPMFSRTTYSAARLPWTRSGNLFTGVAFQNPATNPTQVTLELLTSGNQVLQTANFPLPGKSKMTEDLLDFFAQPNANAVAVRIKSSESIQILGLQGDSGAGTIKPLIVSVP
jgi:hypothetical protein